MGSEISQEIKVNSSNRDNEVSERARSFVIDQFSVRGRFALLEKLSGISADQWRNFYYAKQRINEQMLAFLVKKYPHDEIWLLTGQRVPEQAKFPFSAPIPKESDCETIGTRLNWVIREWASPKGNALFEYLQQVSSEAGTCKKISADDWAQVVLGLAEPTVEMIATVCISRPHFTEWVILGGSGYSQVDPTSETSVAEWNARKESDWAELEKSFRATKKHGNKKA